MNLLDIYNEIKDINLPDGWDIKCDNTRIIFESYDDILEYSVYRCSIVLSYSNDDVYYLYHDDASSVYLNEMIDIKSSIEYYINRLDEVIKKEQEFKRYRNKFYKDIYHDNIVNNVRNFKLNKVI